MNRVVIFCAFALLALQQCLLADAKPTDTQSFLVIHKCEVSRAVKAAKAASAKADAALLAKNTEVATLTTENANARHTVTQLANAPLVQAYLAGVVQDLSSLNLILTPPVAPVSVPVKKYYDNVARIIQLNTLLPAAQAAAATLATKAATAKAAVSLDKIKTRLAGSSKPWIIHGLWPVTKDNTGANLPKTANVYANPSATVGIAKHWPNCFEPANPDKFWSHEWTDHGVYNNDRTSAEYFKDTVDALVANVGHVDTLCKGALTSKKVVQNIIITNDGDCAVVVQWNAGNTKWELLPANQYMY